MKTKLLIASILMLAFGVSLSAQNITGAWLGTLKLPQGKLKIIFNLSPKGDGYAATMDSPDQGAMGIPTTLSTFNPPLLKIEVAAAQIKYTGTYQDGKFKGTFEQGGTSLPLDLSLSGQKSVINRPQEPIPPFSYQSEEVVFPNSKAGIELAGTLTMPTTGSNFPVAILITGSGPQNRDEELMGHKPFLVIADYLTRHGIAVLRYDDRGTAQSTGNFARATSTDFAEDATAAMAYLKTRKEINPKQIGLIGHSEGGLIAAMVASASKQVSFIAMLAGPGMKGDELLLLQKRLIDEKLGLDPATVDKSEALLAGAYQIITENNIEETALGDSVYQYFLRHSENTFSSEQCIALTQQIVSPWFTFFLRTDPAVYLGQVTCPVIALNGSKDIQVPPKENLERIIANVESNGNKQVTAVELENLNHLFQECNTGLPSEYGTIEQTCSPLMLEALSTWLHSILELH